jgi:hypothetical protein
MIDRLFDEGLGPDEIARRVRSDGSLSKIERRMALNLVLRRSTDLRGEADARGASHDACFRARSRLLTAWRSCGDAGSVDGCAAQRLRDEPG